VDCKTGEYRAIWLLARIDSLAIAKQTKAVFASANELQGGLTQTRPIGGGHFFDQPQRVFRDSPRSIPEGQRPASSQPWAPPKVTVPASAEGLKARNNEPRENSPEASHYPAMGAIFRAPVENFSETFARK
jgi:hypothetical protein